MTKTPSGLLIGLFALAGCDSFTLVEPPGNQPPMLSVHLHTVNDQSIRYDLNAAFRRGTDARGNPTEVADKALYVEGKPLLPDPEATRGIWSYRWLETGVPTGARRDSVRVTFPVVAGSSTGAYSMMIPVPHREDPADIALTRGDDLRLHVSPHPRTTAELSGSVDHWILEIRQSCSGSDARPQLAVTGMSAYPSELRVPWQWLEMPAGESFSACLRTFSTRAVIDSPYPAFVTVIAELAWQIRVTEATSLITP